ncbi:helix-turn-helix domain-containing protein [Neorhizobium sp. DT-125]|uniref:helix-turn-helix domain-containing protein n=1 Tax=Neorhizobium sp. DT-125 TaxID=3396163 RepID=UPI003F1BDB13
MSGDFLTVDAAADMLHLHPKTVLRFIREERLRATKVGKQYRILRSDLNAFAGPNPTRTTCEARATSIVDIEEVDAALLQRLSAVLLGASNGKEPPDTPISLNIAHDPTRRSAKVIIIASTADAAMLLKLVAVCLEG